MPEACDKRTVNTISVAIQRNQFEEVDAFLMETFGGTIGEAPEALLQTAMHRCAKVGNIIGTVWCSERLVHLCPNPICLNAILAACAKTGDTKTATEWWNRMCSNGFEPNNITYNTMIHACARAVDAESTVLWMQKLLASEVQPCKVSFAATISVFARLGKLDEAEAWYEIMEKHNVEPDTCIFNTLICACAKAGKCERTDFWLSRMQLRDLFPDQKTYNCMINIAAKSGDLPKALSFFRNMEMNEQAPDLFTFGPLLNACAINADVAMGERCMQDIWDRGLRPNVICYNTMITCCANAADAERAMYWYQSLQQQRVQSKHNTHKGVMNACVNARRRDLAELALENMLRCGFQIDTSILSMLQALDDTKSQRSSEWPHLAILKACIRTQFFKMLNRWILQARRIDGLSDAFYSELYACANQASHEVLSMLHASLPMPDHLLQQFNQAHFHSGCPQQGFAEYDHFVAQSGYGEFDSQSTRFNAGHANGLFISESSQDSYQEGMYFQSEYAYRNSHREDFYFNSESTQSSQYPVSSCPSWIDCANKESICSSRVDAHDFSSRYSTLSELTPDGDEPLANAANNACSGGIVPPDCPPDVKKSWLANVDQA
eukprot:TRINITY_DN22589_c0_g1_i1.p1 TRINITY_DN22589_c0_g1~~TRINITY_DN22589_c0_g1_i1.p1  ORF type:complete len:607 (-),score=72.34 TRINITY_DN22589_c0_g1_i1:85-1905(-)